jgi:hypothetical protein
MVKDSRCVSQAESDPRLLPRFAQGVRNPCCHLTAQPLRTILGAPDAMEVDGERCLGTMAIVTHAPESSENLLKLPPQGGGFAPPNRRQ